MSFASPEMPLAADHSLGTPSLSDPPASGFAPVGADAATSEVSVAEYVQTHFFNGSLNWSHVLHNWVSLAGHFSRRLQLLLEFFVQPSPHTRFVQSGVLHVLILH